MLRTKKKGTKKGRRKTSCQGGRRTEAAHGHWGGLSAARPCAEAGFWGAPTSLGMISGPWAQLPARHTLGKQWSHREGNRAQPETVRNVPRDAFTSSVCKDRWQEADKEGQRGRHARQETPLNKSQRTGKARAAFSSRNPRQGGCHWKRHKTPTEGGPLTLALTTSLLASIQQLYEAMWRETGLRWNEEQWEEHSDQTVWEGHSSFQGV